MRVLQVLCGTGSKAKPGGLTFEDEDGGKDLAFRRPRLKKTHRSLHSIRRIWNARSAAALRYLEQRMRRRPIAAIGTLVQNLARFDP